MNKIVLTQLGGVPAMGSVAGKAEANLCHIDQDWKVTVIDKIIPIVNIFGSQIGGDKFVICSEIEGQWVVVGDPC